ncbi:response regulator transcription factor [Nocardia sp. NPDC004711]
MLGHTDQIPFSWPVPLKASRSPETFRILIAQDDPAESEDLSQRLRRHGHSADVVQSGSEILHTIENPALVLLDLELPDIDGLEVCRAVRTISAVPIIVVTARGDELDRVLAFRSGADDYVVKPYSFRELLCRIHAVMRRSVSTESQEAPLKFGALRIEPARRAVFVHGRRVETTRKEFDLLLMLACNPHAFGLGDQLAPRSTTTPPRASSSRNAWAPPNSVISTCSCGCAISSRS